MTTKRYDSVIPIVKQSVTTRQAAESAMMIWRSWWIPVMNGSLPGQGFETDELQRRKVEQIWQQLRQRKH